MSQRYNNHSNNNRRNPHNYKNNANVNHTEYKASDEKNVAQENFINDVYPIFEKKKKLTYRIFDQTLTQNNVNPDALGKLWLKQCYYGSRCNNHFCSFYHGDIQKIIGEFLQQRNHNQSHIKSNHDLPSNDVWVVTITGETNGDDITFFDIENAVSNITENEDIFEVRTLKKLPRFTFESIVFVFELESAKYLCHQLKLIRGYEIVCSMKENLATNVRYPFTFSIDFLPLSLRQEDLICAIKTKFPHILFQTSLQYTHDYCLSCVIDFMTDNERVEVYEYLLRKEFTQQFKLNPRLNIYFNPAEEVDTKEQNLKETEQNLKETEQNLKETEQNLKETEQNLKETEQKWKETEQNLKETDRKWKEREQKWNEKEHKWKETDRKWKEKEQKLNEREQKLNEREQKWKETEQNLKETEQNLKETDRKGKERDQKLNKREQKLESDQEQLERCQEQLERCQEQLERCQEQLKLCQEQLKREQGRNPCQYLWSFFA